MTNPLKPTKPNLKLKRDLFTIVGKLTSDFYRAMDFVDSERLREFEKAHEGQEEMHSELPLGMERLIRKPYAFYGVLRYALDGGNDRGLAVSLLGIGGFISHRHGFSHLFLFCALMVK